jgi:hypothetical protein
VEEEGEGEVSTDREGRSDDSQQVILHLMCGFGLLGQAATVRLIG